jgi:hypothetical protein
MGAVNLSTQQDRVPIEAGDRVRTDTKQYGDVVILNDDRTLAFVSLDYNHHSEILAQCRVETLTKVGEKPA